MQKYFLTEQDVNLILEKLDDVRVKDYKVIIQLLKSKPVEEEKSKK